jgi:hypothetical protein
VSKKAFKQFTNESPKHLTLEQLTYLAGQHAGVLNRIVWARIPFTNSGVRRRTLFYVWAGIVTAEILTRGSVSLVLYRLLAEVGVL